MNDQPFEELERSLLSAGQALRYPRTPDLASRVMQRIQELPSGRSARARPGLPAQRTRLVYALAVILVLLAGLLAVPSVRAQILEFIQIGVVRIFVGPPTPTPTLPPPAATLQLGPSTLYAGTPSPTLRSSATPFPTPTPLTSLLDLEGETTLATAAQQVDFPILLPSYPPELGVPDKVYLQDIGGQALVLVWLRPGDAEEATLSLHLLTGPQNISIYKYDPEILRETSVGSNSAVWAEGPYFLKLVNGNYESLRMVSGHVLLWTDGTVTYRLESNVEMEEAVRIAESLQPME